MAAISQTTLSNAFFNENLVISIEISLKFVHKGQFNNIPALVYIMAWRLPGDRRLNTDAFHIVYSWNTWNSQPHDLHK